jgi:glutathione S-transferase
MLILHQYDASPFSREGAPASSPTSASPGTTVEQPTIMPKTEAPAAHGRGYRRIPVLQIGAAVYCDTQLIVRVSRATPSRAD